MIEDKDSFREFLVNEVEEDVSYIYLAMQIKNYIDRFEKDDWITNFQNKYIKSNSRS